VKVNLDNIKNDVETKTNYTDRLLMKLPGYDNYIKNKQFYEMDRIVREYLSKNIILTKSKVQSFISEIIDDGKMQFIKPLESLTLNLERIFKKIQYASFGNSNENLKSEDQNEIKERVIEYDWRLISESEILEQKCSSLSSSNENLDVLLKELKAELEKIESEFDKRKEVLLEEI